MSGSASTPAGGAPRDESYGPDRTLVQVADWLTANAPAIDRLFHECPNLEAMRIDESMTTQHPEVEDQSISPKATYQYDFTGGPRAVEIDTAVRPIVAAAGASGELLRKLIVLCNDEFYQDNYCITLRRNALCEGSVRLWCADEIIGQASELGASSGQVRADFMEHYFTWTRQGAGFVGTAIELRLWTPYLADYLVEATEREKTALQGNPASILDHPEIGPFRESSFRLLYEMRRPPARLEFSVDHIRLFYDGEAAEFRENTSILRTAGAPSGVRGPR